MKPVVLRGEGLTRRFGGVEAVVAVTIEVHAGEVFGLIGPNGSGKTTTVRMMVGLDQPDEGSVTVEGVAVRELGDRLGRVLGYVPDEPPLYPRMTGQEMLDLVASLHGIDSREADERALRDLARFDFDTEALGRFTDGYSRGMKRKLALTIGLLHRPSLVVMDEPTDSLDVVAVHRVRELVTDLREAGCAVLLATNDLETAQAVCDRVGLLMGGRMVYHGPVEASRRDLAAMTGLEAVIRNEIARQRQ